MPVQLSETETDPTNGSVAKERESYETQWAREIVGTASEKFEKIRTFFDKNGERETLAETVTSLLSID